MSRFDPRFVPENTTAPDIRDTGRAATPGAWTLRPALDNAHSTEWIGDALSHADPKMRSFAIQQVGSLGAEGSVQFVDELSERFLREEKVGIRNEALEVLANIPANNREAYQKAVRIFGQAICDPNIAIRTAGWKIPIEKMEVRAPLLTEYANRIGNSRDDSLARPFAALAEKADAEGVSAVATVLKQFVKSDHFLMQTRQLAGRVLLRAGVPGVPQLLARASLEQPLAEEREAWEKDGSTPELTFAMNSLLIQHAKDGHDVSDALKVFKEALVSSDTSDFEKTVALHVLGRRSEWRERFRREIQYASTDSSSPQTRGLAFHIVLKDCESPDLQKQLIHQALHDPHPVVRAKGLAAYFTNPDLSWDRDIESRVEELLMDTDPQIVGCAAHVLGDKSGRDALPMLQDFAELSRNREIQDALNRQIRLIKDRNPVGLRKVLDRVDRGLRASWRFLRRSVDFPEKSTLEKMDDVLREHGFDPAQFHDD